MGWGWGRGDGDVKGGEKWRRIRVELREEGGGVG